MANSFWCNVKRETPDGVVNKIVRIKESVGYQETTTAPRINGSQADRFLNRLNRDKIEGLHAVRTRVRNRPSMESEDSKPTTTEAGL
jgi:hypothetical protein